MRACADLPGCRERTLHARGNNFLAEFMGTPYYVDRIARRDYSSITRIGEAIRRSDERTRLIDGERRPAYLDVRAYVRRAKTRKITRNFPLLAYIDRPRRKSIRLHARRDGRAFGGASSETHANVGRRPTERYIRRGA